MSSEALTTVRLATPDCETNACGARFIIDVRDALRSVSRGSTRITRQVVELQ